MNVRRKSLLLVGISLAIGSWSCDVDAGVLAALNQVGRSFGYGFSDGYHASGSCANTKDLGFLTHKTFSGQRCSHDACHKFGFRRGLSLIVSPTVEPVSIDENAVIPEPIAQPVPLPMARPFPMLRGNIDEKAPLKPSALDWRSRR